MLGKSSKRSKRIAIVSPKGGVGKTTVTANLSEALVGRGRRVCAVDLDAQNALQFHLSADPVNPEGLASATLRSEPWSETLRKGVDGLRFLPFGFLSEKHREQFEQAVVDAPAWLADGLSTVDHKQTDYTVFDTPPGPSEFQRAAVEMADLVIVVVLPDAASFITVPTVERTIESYAGQTANQFAGLYFLLNRMNEGRVLCRDVRAMLADRLGDRLVPETIRFDAAAEEALAAQQTVMAYEPDGRAATDFDGLAAWVEQTLK